MIIHCHWKFSHKSLIKVNCTLLIIRVIACLDAYDKWTEFIAQLVFDNYSTVWQSRLKIKKSDVLKAGDVKFDQMSQHRCPVSATLAVSSVGDISYWGLTRSSHCCFTLQRHGRKTRIGQHINISCRHSETAQRERLIAREASECWMSCHCMALRE